MNKCERCEQEFEGETYLGTEGQSPWCELCFLRAQNDGLRGQLRARERDLQGMRAELKGEKDKLATEREGLISWLRSRIAQQQQIFKIPMAQEVRKLAEIEISFVERYLEVIESGKHRNNQPTVSVPDGAVFKPLRLIEREAVEKYIQEELNIARSPEGYGRDGKEEFLEGAENVLTRVLQGLAENKHRTD